MMMLNSRVLLLHHHHQYKELLLLSSLLLLLTSNIVVGFHPVALPRKRKPCLSFLVGSSCHHKPSIINRVLDSKKKTEDDEEEDATTTVDLLKAYKDAGNNNDDGTDDVNKAKATKNDAVVKDEGENVKMDDEKDAAANGEKDKTIIKEAEEIVADLLWNDDGLQVDEDDDEEIEKNVAEDYFVSVWENEQQGKGQLDEDEADEVLLPMEMREEDSDNQVGQVDLNNDENPDQQQEETDPFIFVPNLGGEMVNICLENHVPMGCTVEESLAEEADGALHVFVSKVTKGGNADQAGLKVGDVIIGVTGTFEKLEVVSGRGVEIVKSMVGAVEEEVPLEIRVLRGTDVMERHEEAIIELCTLTVDNDKKIEECLTAFVEGEYSLDDDDTPTNGEMTNANNGTENDEVMNHIFNMWAADMDELIPKPLKPENVTETVEPKVKPWSSRSSPSGTYVRDPTTGQMRNIDA